MGKSIAGVSFIPEHEAKMLITTQKFPDYEYREYPKYVTFDGKSVLVNDSEEEAAAQPAEPDSDERTALFAEAEAKGIKVDKRWGVDKLRAALVVD